MKKYILTCIATLLGVFFAQADNINVQNVTMDVGQSGTIDICLTNTATNYVSFQMDLYLPDGFTLNKTGNTLSSRFSNGELTIGKQSDGAFRLMGTSLPLNPITGTDGVLITLSVNAPATVMSGTANINNIRFATRQSEKTTMADVSFTMTAIGNQSLSLSSLPTMTYGDAAYTLPSETDQGLSLSWSVDDTSVATVSGNTLTIKGAGTATVTATQSGNNLYNAFSKEYTLTVNKAALTITAKNYIINQGDPLPTFEATYEGFKNGETSSVLTTQPSFSCSASSSNNSGNYTITVSGAEASNYEITYVNGKLTIMGEQHSPISALPEYTYGEGSDYSLPRKTHEGDIITWSSSNSSVASIRKEKDDQALIIEYSWLCPHNAGTATITASANGYSCYKPFHKEFTVTVNKAPLTITAQNYTIEQGQPLPTFTATYAGFKNNETVSVLTTLPTISCNATSTSPAGTYDINVSGAEARNYEMNYVKGTLTIRKRTQTITLDDNLVMTYGNGTFTLPEETDQELLIDWSSSNTAVAAVVGNTLVIKGAGTATLTAEQEGDNNNQPLTKDYTLTVNKAPLTITAQSYTIEQGQALPTFAATYEGFVNNQTASVLTKQPTFSCEVTNSDVPGTYTITPSGAEAKNYEMTYVAGTLTITEQPACTVTAKNYTIKFGDALPEFEYTSEGFELEGTPELSCEATSASPVGTYPITVTKGSLTNYNVTYVAGTLTIEKAPLKVTVQNADMTYGNALPTFEAAYEGFKNNDNATVLTTTPTMTTTATSSSAVGTYEITASGAEAQNYEMNYVKGTLTISKAALTVTPKNVSMTYGDALPTFEAIYEGFKNDDDASVLNTLPSMTTAATPSSTVGIYTIAADGAEAENYVISYGSGTLTVEKAPLTITAQDCTMKQGDPLPAFDATFEGFKNNETASVLTKQPKLGCEATSASELGTYDIIVSGAEAQNYEIIYVKGTLTITQADPVTITANSYTIKYGDDIPMLEFTSDGATLSGTPTLNCEATSTSPVGTYPITVTKGSVENYNVTYVAGTLTIEKAPLTITAQSYTIVQGEAFPEFEAFYDGFKNGETADVLTRKPSLATLADEYSNPGEYEILVAGARANNYDITYVNGVLTIEEPQTGITTFIARIPDSSVVMRSRNGEITVEGLADGQKVSIHTYGGMLVGTATTVDGKATINTSLTPGSIVIVKVGNKTVKYVVR